MSQNQPPIDLGDVSGTVKIDASVGDSYKFTMIGDTTADMLNLTQGDQLSLSAVQDSSGGWVLDFTSDGSVGTQIDLSAAQGPGLTSDYVFVRSGNEYTPLANTANNVDMPQTVYTSGSSILVGANGPLPIDCSMVNAFLVNINDGEFPEPIFFGVTPGRPVFVVFVQPSSGYGKITWNTAGQKVDDLINIDLDVSHVTPSATGFTFVGMDYGNGDIHLQLVNKSKVGA